MPGGLSEGNQAGSYCSDESGFYWRQLVRLAFRDDRELWRWLDTTIIGTRCFIVVVRRRRVGGGVPFSRCDSRSAQRPGRPGLERYLLVGLGARQIASETVRRRNGEAYRGVRAVV